MKRHLLNDAKNRIILLQSVFFNTESIELCKLDKDASSYDLSYENEVKRPQIGLVVILYELLMQINQDSKSFPIFCAMEQKLFSPDFYRNFIFEKKSNVYSDLLKLQGALDDDIKILSHHKHHLKYKVVIEDIGEESLPRELVYFFEELVCFKSFLADLIARADNIKENNFRVA